jgi:hypothetical protein
MQDSRPLTSTYAVSVRDSSVLLVNYDHYSPDRALGVNSFQQSFTKALTYTPSGQFLSTPLSLRFK